LIGKSDRHSHETSLMCISWRSFRSIGIDGTKYQKSDCQCSRKSERSVEQASMEVVLCMADAMAEPREAARVHHVPVSSMVEPVPAVERGKVGRHADQLVPVKRPGYDQTSAEFLCWPIVNVHESAILCCVV
jgi:hypothetical protein